MFLLVGDRALARATGDGPITEHQAHIQLEAANKCQTGGVDALLLR